MTYAEILSLGSTIVSYLIQAYKLEQQIQPELIEAFEIWCALVQAKINGTEITEDQVSALETKIEILSASNAAKEQAIINPTAV